MKFTDDLLAPLPPKVESQPPPPAVVVPVEPKVEAHQLNEPEQQAPQHPSPHSRGTVRTDASSEKGPWTDNLGRLVHTRPKFHDPVKAVPTPVRYDPHKKCPDSGESSHVFSVVNGKVKDCTTGAYIEGKIESPMSGFSVLVRGMSSGKL